MATFILLTTPQGDCRVPMDITYSASGDVISVSLIYEGNESETVPLKTYLLWRL